MERGGGETFDLEIARSLQELGCEITFLTGIPLFSDARIKNPYSTFRLPPSAFRIRSPYMGWLPWDVVRGGWRLRAADYWMFERAAARWAAGRAGDFDAIQVCELPTFVHAWKRREGLPPVVMRLTAPNYLDPGNAIGKADGIIASGMTIERLHGGERTDAVDVANSVDTERFRPHASSFREKNDLSSDTFVALYVARFQAFKQHTVLVRAFASFLERLSDSRLVLVGSGPLRERTENLCRELGVRDHVLFLGEVPFEDIPDVYAGVDLKVVTSDFESFCFAAIEAMATELAIVTTDCGWVPRLIQENKGGMVVPVNDPDAFAAAMLELAREPERRREMGHFNREVVLEKYRWEQNAQKLLNLYKHLLSK